MISNDATAAEIAASIDERVREAIPVALDAARRERAPAPPVPLVAGITQFVGLVGQNWTPDGRTEFIGLARAELSLLPGDMVLAALADARREVSDGRYLVNWVYKAVEKRTSRLDIEIKRLEFLASLLPNEG